MHGCSRLSHRGCRLNRYVAHVLLLASRNAALDEVHRRWESSILAIEAAIKRAHPKPRLVTRFIESGSIVVPGISGKRSTRLTSM